MKSRRSNLLPFAIPLAATTALSYASYRRDLRAAIQRVESQARAVDTESGMIEFGEHGEGPPVLVIHGAGGGYDQGLDLGRAFLGEGYRLIAPSRFGYLGTPMPLDASPEAQADAHARLLDALHVDRVPVIGVSAGGPSAIQFCLRHPDRCSGLVLIVPMVWMPDREATPPPSRFVATLIDTMVASDFLFWGATKLARRMLVRTLLGTPDEVYTHATAAERIAIDRLLDEILPMSRRAAGIVNEGAVASTLGPYPVETIHVPTLVMSTADDGYRTYDSSLYTAGRIPGAKFVGFANGGHLLVGHELEVRFEVTQLVKTATRVGAEPALAT